MKITFDHRRGRTAGARPADPEKRAASVLALSAEELKAIRRFALSRTHALRGVRYYADADDLLHEAIAKTLEGSRAWTPQRVGLVAHLKGCVRSIAANYEGKGRRRAETLLDDLPSGHGGQAYRQALLSSMRALLKPHALALNIFDLLLEGRAAGAIQTILQLDRAAYNAARKRMMRLLRANFSASQSRL
jgi:DNA-directed RNA polymerase specialized sigma24 family protein